MIIIREKMAFIHLGEGILIHNTSWLELVFFISIISMRAMAVQSEGRVRVKGKVGVEVLEFDGTRNSWSVKVGMDGTV